MFVDYGELKPGEGAPKGCLKHQKGFGNYKNLLPLKVHGKCCCPMEKVLLAHSKVNAPIKLRNLPCSIHQFYALYRQLSFLALKIIDARLS